MNNSVVQIVEVVIGVVTGVTTMIEWLCVVGIGTVVLGSTV